MPAESGVRSVRARMLRWLVVSATAAALISAIVALALTSWRMGGCPTNAACKWHRGLPWIEAATAGAFSVIVLLLAVVSLLLALAALLALLLELLIPSLKLNPRLLWSAIGLLISAGAAFLLTWVLYTIWSDWQGGYPSFAFWFWVNAGLGLFLGAAVQRLAMRWDEERAAKATLRQ